MIIVIELLKPGQFLEEKLKTEVFWLIGSESVISCEPDGAER